MTNSRTPMIGQRAFSQMTDEDRKAARACIENADEDPGIAEAFARHRMTARREALEEAAASFADLTVKWEGHSRGDAFAMANARIRAMIEGEAE